MTLLHRDHYAWLWSPHLNCYHSFSPGRPLLLSPVFTFDCKDSGWRPGCESPLWVVKEFSKLTGQFYLYIRPVTTVLCVKGKYIPVFMWLILIHTFWLLFWWSLDFDVHVFKLVRHWDITTHWSFKMTSGLKLCYVLFVNARLEKGK